MQQPSLDLLMQKVGSKYELVVAAAKRGRMLTEVEDQHHTDGKALKPVSIALNEIANDQLLIELPRFSRNKR